MITSPYAIDVSRVRPSDIPDHVASVVLTLAAEIVLDIQDGKLAGRDVLASNLLRVAAYVEQEPADA